MLQNRMENYHTNSEKERKKEVKGLNLVLLHRVSQEVILQLQDLIRHDPEIIGLFIQTSLQTIRNFHKFELKFDDLTTTAIYEF